MSRPIIQPGTRIADFVVGVVLGAGGMGQVYRAHQIGVDRPVALKVLAPVLAADAEFVRRFRREATTMRDLEHPAILAVYAAGEDRGLVYLAMRLVNGPSLAQLLADRGPLAAQALSIIEPLSHALDYAHSRGVIHRDIKPANVLLDADGRPFLADFGISKQLDSPTHTVTGPYLGTPRYMAPEQADGAGVSHRADLYSLACVTFEMLTGQAPFTEHDTIPLLLAHASKPVPAASRINTALPAAVDGVFTRALAKMPSARFPSAGEFVEALRTALVTQPQVATRTRRRVGYWSALTATAIVITLSTALMLAQPAARQLPALPPPATRVAVPSIGDAPRGKLIYAAELDGTGRGFVDLVGRGGITDRSAVRYLPGVVELATLAPNANSGTDLNLNLTTFVGDIVLSVVPGSEVDFCWSLRWAVPGKLAYELCMNTAGEFVNFSVWNGENHVPITPRVGLAGLQRDRVVQATVVVRESRLTLFIDGRQAADVEDRQVPVRGTAPGLDVYGKEGTGTVRVQGLRIYQLAGT